MADQERNFEERNHLRYHEHEQMSDGAADHLEETSAELAAPITFNRTRTRDNDMVDRATSGRGIGFLALFLSILSLFVQPILIGAAGIVFGFIAMRKGAESLGSWAIGLGAISIIVGIFILPFF